ncbi:MAG TPA: hypothetical protein VL294_07340 [Pseudolysinimonas sp.]|nr:hypothetical protein [Pseudolysinimonas sp.]
MLRLTVRALARRWPELLAWYLAGWAARLMLIQFAGWAGSTNSLIGLSLLPLAVLARLASYIGMFLVLRSEMTRYEQIESVVERTGGVGAPSFLSSWASTVGAALVPFFVIYAAWGLTAEDGRAYTLSALNQTDFGADSAQVTPLDTPFTWQTVTIVVVAFVLRRVLAHFADRLPRWVGIISTYLEAVWIFIALAFIGDLLAGIPEWLATRRMFAWAVDGWGQLRSEFRVVEWLGDALQWTSVQLGNVVFQPLAWLALASIVLAGALPLAARRRSVRMRRARASFGRQWSRLGPRTRRILMLPVTGILERWQPVATALRLIWGAGPAALGVYVLAFAVLTVGTSWLQTALYHAWGPHEAGWWLAWDQPLSLLVGVLTFPVQICLVAAAFDRCLRALDARTTDAEAVNVLAGADTEDSATRR